MENKFPQTNNNNNAARAKTPYRQTVGAKTNCLWALEHRVKKSVGSSDGLFPKPQSLLSKSCLDFSLHKRSTAALFLVTSLVAQRWITNHSKGFFSTKQGTHFESNMQWDVWCIEILSVLVEKDWLPLSYKIIFEAHLG